MYSVFDAMYRDSGVCLVGGKLESLVFSMPLKTRLCIVPNSHTVGSYHIRSCVSTFLARFVCFIVLITVYIARFTRRNQLHIGTTRITVVTDRYFVYFWA